MVAMTGWLASGSNSVEPGFAEAGYVPGELDHHALQTQAQPEGRDLVLAGVPQRADLALDPADAETAGHADRIDVGEVPWPRPRASRTRPRPPSAA